MLYHLVVVCILIAGALFSAQIVSTRARTKWTPLIFALLIFLVGFRVLSRSALFVRVGLLYSAVGSAFLLNGFRLAEMRKNRTLILFLLFWGYMTLSMFWGDYALMAISTLLHALLGPIAVGYFVGMWAIRDEKNWQRLCVYTLCAIVVVLLAYIKKGGLDVGILEDASMQGRGGISGDLTASEGGINVNLLGLLLAGMLPIPVCAIFTRFNATRTFYRLRWVLRGLAVIVSLVLIIMIIRTGSRNSALSFIPVLWYVLFSSTGIKKWQRFIVAVIFGLMACAVVGRYLYRTKADGLKDLRIFQYITDTTDWGDDQFAGHRMGAFRDRFADRTGMELFRGSGALIGFIDGVPQLGNGHSMYVQVLFQAGFIGSFLLLLFCLAMASKAFSRDPKNGIAVLMFGIWAMTGVGESQNILVGGISKYFLGMGIAFCTNQKFRPPWLPFNRYGGR